jgi:hypothetical protein
MQQSCGYKNTIEFPFISIILYPLSLYETTYPSEAGAINTQLIRTHYFMIIGTLDNLLNVGQ